MEYVTIELGLRIGYRRAGKGPPLVLLHGFICDGRVWARQFDGLGDDFDLIAWDAPGCGASDDPREDCTMPEFGGYLARFLDAIGLESAHVLGHSWGGTLALQYHAMVPRRVRSLILADTYAGWTGSLGEEVAQQRLARCIRESALPAPAWVPQWAPEAFSRSAPPELIDAYVAIMSDFHAAGFRAMSRALTPDLSRLLALVNAPALLIWGDADTRSPLRCAHQMRDAIGQARLAVLPGGHCVNIETPEQFNAEVRSFLRAVEAG
jgi:pimeloyl-ACP methyl ester carboxylesterase